MTRHYFSQGRNKSLVTNSDYPPQNFMDSTTGDTGPTDMLLEKGIEMAFESGIIMEYEGVTT